jgi:hypothetical protein
MGNNLLTDCQSRNEVKIDFHVNTSLTSVSVAKAVYWCEARKQNPNLSFSMADVKTLHFNELFLEKVFSMSAIAAEALKTHPDFHNLLTFGAFHSKAAASYSRTIESRKLSKDSEKKAVKSQSMCSIAMIRIMANRF